MALVFGTRYVITNHHISPIHITRRSIFNHHPRLSDLNNFCYFPLLYTIYRAMKAMIDSASSRGMGYKISGLPLDWTISRFQFMVIAGVIGALVTVFIQTFKVLTELRQKGKSVVDPLKNLLPFLVFLPSSFLWCLFSNVALQTYPIQSVLLISTVFTEMVSHIMLMHICDEELSPFGRVTSFLMLLLPAHVWCSRAVTSGSFLQPVLLAIDESNLLHILTALSVSLTTLRLYLVSCFHSL